MHCLLKKKTHLSYIQNGFPQQKKVKHASYAFGRGTVLVDIEAVLCECIYGEICSIMENFPEIPEKWHHIHEERHVGLASLPYIFKFNKYDTVFRARARALRMEQVLTYCLDNSADRDVWDMADQGMILHHQQPPFLEC